MNNLVTCLHFQEGIQAYVFVTIDVNPPKQKQMRSTPGVCSMVVWGSWNSQGSCPAAVIPQLLHHYQSWGKITRHLLTLIKADSPPETLSHIYCTVMSHAQCQPFVSWQFKYTSLERLQPGWHLIYNEQCHSKLQMNVKVNAWGAIWNWLLYSILQYVVECYLAMEKVCGKEWMT